eukprot:1200-Lingulodinium_polyedra.AAC.1
MPVSKLRPNASPTSMPTEPSWPTASARLGRWVGDASIDGIFGKTNNKRLPGRCRGHRKNCCGVDFAGDGLEPAVG